MHESKIKSFAPFISSIGNIILLFCLGQRAPFRLLLLITPDIVIFSRCVNENIDDTESEQDTIALAVSWCVFGLVNV